MEWVQGSLFDEVEEDEVIFEIGCADLHDLDPLECHEYRADYTAELLRLPGSNSRAIQTYQYGR